MEKNLAKKELKQIWNSAVAVAVAVATIALAILEQRKDNSTRDNCRIAICSFLIWLMRDLDFRLP